LSWLFACEASGLTGRISIAPKPFPLELRRDVIAVARKGEASIAQIARDFGISESCLARWLKNADRDDGLAPPAGGDRGAGPRMSPRSYGVCAGATSCWHRLLRRRHQRRDLHHRDGRLSGLRAALGEPGQPDRRVDQLLLRHRQPAHHCRQGQHRADHLRLRRYRLHQPQRRHHRHLHLRPLGTGHRHPRRWQQHRQLPALRLRRRLRRPPQHPHQVRPALVRPLDRPVDPARQPRNPRRPQPRQPLRIRRQQPHQLRRPDRSTERCRHRCCFCRRSCRWRAGGRSLCGNRGLGLRSGCRSGRRRNWRWPLQWGDVHA
jgi:hypothetical protein